MPWRECRSRALGRMFPKCSTEGEQANIKLQPKGALMKKPRDPVITAALKYGSATLDALRALTIEVA